MNPPTPHSTAPGTPAAGQAEHTPWDYFVGNANGRGLIRIEVENTGEHIASMPRGAKSEARAAHIVHCVNTHAALAARCRELEAAVQDMFKHEFLAKLIADSPENLVDENDREYCAAVQRLHALLPAAPTPKGATDGR